MKISRYRTALACLVLVAMLTLSPASTRVARADLDLGEILLLAAIAAFFAMDDHSVAYYHHHHHLAFADVVLIFYLADVAHVDHHHIAGLRGRGHGWGRIAQDVGIHPGAFNKMRNGFDFHGAPDSRCRDVALVWFTSEYYGRPQSDITYWHSRGHAMPDIFVSLDFSAKSGRPVGDFLGGRKQGRSWEAMATSNHISTRALKQPAHPRGGSEFRPAAAHGKPTTAPGRGASPAAKGPAKATGPAGGAGKPKGPPETKGGPAHGKSGSSGEGTPPGKGKPSGPGKPAAKGKPH